MYTVIIAVVIVVSAMYLRPLMEYQRIPRITIGSTINHLVMYRTSSSRIVNLKMYKNCYQRWLELNPGLTIEWFNNRDCLRFMKTQGEILLRTYQTLRPGAFKADLFRLCILYERGGVYADSNTLPYVSLREMMKGMEFPPCHRFVSVLDCKRSKEGIHNGFIAVSARHPFLRAAIRRIIDNVKRRSYEDHNLAITGPICLSRAINNFLGRDENKVMTVGFNECGEYSFHLLRFGWGYNPCQYVYRRDNTAVLSKKHCLLSLLMDKFKATAYSRMVRNREVYNELDLIPAG